MFERREDRFAVADGTSIFYRSWRPESERGRVILVHGATEHGDRYDHLVTVLTHAGYSVYAADLRGHGRSEGLRGHVTHFSTYAEDLRALVAQLDPAPGPQILYAHSMGALAALQLIAETPEGFDGLVLSGPAIRLRRPPGRGLLRTARLVGALLPLIPVSPGIKSEGLSSDPEVAAVTRADKLMLRRVTIRWATQFFAAQATVEGFARRVSIPTLVLAGEDDGLVDPESIRELTTWIPAEHLTAHVFPGARHELHSETAEHRHRVFAALAKWLERKRIR